MPTREQFFPMRGGLDQETPAIAMKPGVVIDCLNHEARPSGYARVQGYERFDGRAAPSAETFSKLTFNTGLLAFTAGQTVTGGTSAATARVVADATAQSGVLYVQRLTGTFVVGELLKVGGVTYATLLTLPAAVTPANLAELTLLDSSAAYARGLIGAVPGSGAVRGVLWFNNRLNAWRDSGGGTAGIAYYSAPGGWTAHDLGKNVYYTLGGTYKIVAGNTVTGATSGATAVVRRIYTDPSNAIDPWASKVATGQIVLDSVVGTFVAENLNVGANLNVATIAAAPAAAVFPPGGRYVFEIHNFYASTGTERAYGVNGVGKGFEFDGNSILTISTGMPVDTPFNISAHKSHLFMAFPGGSLQHSALGEPISFSALLGASELGLGHEITNMIPNASATFFITTDVSVFVLTGNDSSDWLLEGIGDEDVGAKPWTAQRIGSIIYADLRGIRSATATQAYGNFLLGTYTSLIVKTLEAKRQAGIEPVASIVVKAKDQYLLFFADGTGLSLFFGPKRPEAMLFTFPFVVSCIHAAEVGGRERIWVGATNGFVYELNAGRSFDGGVIDAFIALPYGHQGAPRIIKRYHKLELEMDAGPGTNIGVVGNFDYANGYQPNAESLLGAVGTGGGAISVAAWPGFAWYAPHLGRLEAWLDGLGTNMGAILVTRSALIESYTVQGGTVVFSGRGHKR